MAFVVVISSGKIGHSTGRRFRHSSGVRDPLLGLAKRADGHCLARAAVVHNEFIAGPGPISDHGVCISTKESDHRRMADHVWREVRDQFYDSNFNGADWDQVRVKLMSRRFLTKLDLYTNLRWMFSQLNDRYTCFLPPEAFAAMRANIDGGEVSIGASIRLRRRDRGWMAMLPNFRRFEREFELHGITADGPAYRAGVRDGAQVLAIDGVATSTLSLREVTSALQGPKGSKVSLVVAESWEEKRPAATDSPPRRGRPAPWWRDYFLLQDAPLDEAHQRVYNIQRELVRVESLSFERMDLKRGPFKAVGYIQIREWTKTTYKETRAAVQSFADRSGVLVDAIVIDLRDNVGGVLPEAMDFSKLFLNKAGAKLVRFESRGQTGSYEVTRVNPLVRLMEPLVSRKWRQTTHMASSVPLIVLVNRYTASASELVAAALQHNCRAVLVGTRTFGKDSVQAVMKIPDDDAGFKLTIAKYLTPKKMDEDGLEPDIEDAELARGRDAVRDILPRYAGNINRLARNCTAP